MVLLFGIVFQIHTHSFTLLILCIVQCPPSLRLNMKHSWMKQLLLWLILTYPRACNCLLMEEICSKFPLTIARVQRRHLEPLSRELGSSVMSSPRCILRRSWMVMQYQKEGMCPLWTNPHLHNNEYRLCISLFPTNFTKLWNYSDSQYCITKMGP